MHCCEMFHAKARHVLCSRTTRHGRFLKARLGVLRSIRAELYHSPSDSYLSEQTAKMPTFHELIDHLKDVGRPCDAGVFNAKAGEATALGHLDTRKGGGPGHEVAIADDTAANKEEMRESLHERLKEDSKESLYEQKGPRDPVLEGLAKPSNDNSDHLDDLMMELERLLVERSYGSCEQLIGIFKRLEPIKKSTRLFFLINAFVSTVFQARNEAGSDSMQHLLYTDENFYMLTDYFVASSTSLHCLGLLYCLAGEAWHGEPDPNPSPNRKFDIKNTQSSPISPTEWIRSHLKGMKPFLYSFNKKISHEHYHPASFPPHILSSLLIRVSLIWDGLPRPLFEYLYILNRKGYALNIESFNAALMELYIKSVSKSDSRTARAAEAAGGDAEKLQDIEYFWQHMKHSRIFNHYSYFTMINFYLKKSKLKEMRTCEAEAFALGLDSSKPDEFERLRYNETLAMSDEIKDGIDMDRARGAARNALLNSGDSEVTYFQHFHALNKRQQIVILLMKSYAGEGAYLDYIRLFKYGISLATSDHKGESFKFQLVSNFLYTMGLIPDLYHTVMKTAPDLLMPCCINRNGLPIYMSHYSLLLTIYFRHDKLALVSMFHSVNSSEIIEKCPQFIPTIFKEYCGKSPISMKKLLMNLALDRFHLHLGVREQKDQAIPRIASILYDIDHNLGILYQHIESRNVKLLFKSHYYRLLRHLYYNGKVSAINSLYLLLLASSDASLNIKTFYIYFVSFMRENEWELVKKLILEMKIRRLQLTCERTHMSFLQLLDYLQQVAIFSNSTELGPLLQKLLPAAGDSLSVPDDVVALLEMHQVKALGTLRKLVSSNIIAIDKFPDAIRNIIQLPPYIEHFKKEWFEHFDFNRI